MKYSRFTLEGSRMWDFRLPDSSYPVIFSQDSHIAPFSIFIDWWFESCENFSCRRPYRGRRQYRTLPLKKTIYVHSCLLLYGIMIEVQMHKHDSYIFQLRWRSSFVDRSVCRLFYQKHLRKQFRYFHSINSTVFNSANRVTAYRNECENFYWFQLLKTEKKTYKICAEVVFPSVTEKIVILLLLIAQ